MKKAITTILSVLLLVSCLTVNVFADETDAGNLLAETADELNALEEISEVEREDTVKDDSVITVNDDKALNVYHKEQNGSDEWTFIISLTDYYSDQPLTATVKCGSEVRFSQFMEDGSQIDSFTRLENGDVIMTLPKNGRTRIVLGDGDNAKEHLVSVECDYEQILECSYFGGIEFDDSFGFMFVMNDSQYNSTDKFFDTLAMTLIVDKNSHQAILNAINSGSDTDLEEVFYTIHFKYDTLISKDFGVDVIDGFDTPYVLYQVSYEGVTENIIIYFNCNDNSNNDNIEPAISNVILVMGSTEIPLKCNYRHEKNIFEWTVDFNTFDENLGEDYYWSYINSGSPVKIKYKTGNNDDYVTIDDNSFVIGVIDELDIYTKYATYTDNETGQKHIFYLEPKTQVIDLDDVDEIKVSLNGNEKAISLDSYGEVEGRRFYKPSEAFNFVDSAVFALTINIRNKEPLTFTYEDLRKDIINYPGTEVNIQGAKFYSKNDNCFIYFCSNYEIIDLASGSFIKPFDNRGYWVNKRGDNEYVWTFNVDIEQFYNGNTVLLMKNNTAGWIDFAQTQQSINQSGLAEIKKVNGGFSIKPVFGSDLVFTATSNGVNQTHIICIQFDKNSILNKTGIKSVGITDGFYNFMTNESIYNLNKGMFDSVAISANMPVYKLNQFISDVTGGDGVDLSQYLQFSFKGYQMKGNPSYIVSNGSFGKMVKVNFEISNGSAVETVVVYCQRIVDNKDHTLISIDGKEFYQEAFGDTLIYLPATNGSILEFDFNEIVNAVNSSTVQHKVIVVDYSIDFLNNGFNSSQRNIEYVDGYEMEESVRISLELYYLDNPDVLKNGNLSKQNDLTRVNSFNRPINTSFLLDTF
ncbi:MAG: hypothetical protein SO103_03300, partial [Erysipelotrichaceae bacterium]|nr:hypothetical protein [Erysipelotrichaceae bacterium]